MNEEYIIENLVKMNYNRLKNICINNNILIDNKSLSKYQLIILILKNQNVKNNKLKQCIQNNMIKFKLFFYNKEKLFNEVEPEFIDSKEKDEDKQCVICFENKKIIVGQCNHLCICHNCNNDILNNNNPLCPICRSVWKNTKVIYW